MHEHVGEELVNPKVRGFKEMQAKDVIQVNIEAFKSKGGYKHQYIDNQ